MKAFSLIAIVLAYSASCHGEGMRGAAVNRAADEDVKAQGFDAPRFDGGYSSGHGSRVGNFLDNHPNIDGSRVGNFLDNHPNVDGSRVGNFLDNHPNIDGSRVGNFLDNKNRNTFKYTSLWFGLQDPDGNDQGRVYMSLSGNIGRGSRDPQAKVRVILVDSGRYVCTANRDSCSNLNSDTDFRVLSAFKGRTSSSTFGLSDFCDWRGLFNELQNSELSVSCYGGSSWRIGDFANQEPDVCGDINYDNANAGPSNILGGGGGNGIFSWRRGGGNSEMMAERRALTNTDSATGAVGKATAEEEQLQDFPYENYLDSDWDMGDWTDSRARSLQSSSSRGGRRSGSYYPQYNDRAWNQDSNSRWNQDSNSRWNQDSNSRWNQDSNSRWNQDSNSRWNQDSNSRWNQDSNSRWNHDSGYDTGY